MRNGQNSFFLLGQLAKDRRLPSRCAKAYSIGLSLHRDELATDMFSLMPPRHIETCSPCAKSEERSVI
jgi:hypothetical protein